jgi:hypothetical protein
MRVSEEGRVPARRPDPDRRGDFGAALRRAQAGRAEIGRPARRADDQAARHAPEASLREEGAGEALPARRARAAGVGREEGPADLAAWGDATARAGATATLATGPGGAGRAGGEGEPGRVPLAQAVLALGPVIEAFQASGRVALSLDFGGALGVELRGAPEGVEVLIRASAALLPAARAELAGLCRSLAARGVAVASAEVRGGAPPRGRRR